MRVGVDGVRLLLDSLVSGSGIKTDMCPFFNSRCSFMLHCTSLLSLPPPLCDPHVCCLQLPSTFHWQLDSLLLSLCWPLLVQDWGAFAVWWGPACIHVYVFAYVWCGACVCVHVLVCTWHYTAVQVLAPWEEDYPKNNSMPLTGRKAIFVHRGALSVPCKLMYSDIVNITKYEYILVVSVFYIVHTTNSFLYYIMLYYIVLMYALMWPLPLLHTIQN